MKSNIGGAFIPRTEVMGVLHRRLLKNNQDFDQLFRIIRANSSVVAITEHDWIDAGKERFEQRKTQKDFGLIDAVMLIKQKEYSCMIITGDKHFKHIGNVVFLE